jgi:hypothetical protein
MARVTRAAAHLSVEEVKSRLKNDPRPWCRERWLIIYNALIDPRKAEDIATLARKRMLPRHYSSPISVPS